MADINHVITLGIGTPADISHFTLVGLSPTGVVAATGGRMLLLGAGCLLWWLLAR